MWLLNARTRQLESFNDEDARSQGYAILSHVWEKEEVTFSDIQCLESHKHKQGYRKLDLTCLQALEDKLSYVWLDTCCIDKSSSAELSEAINSMFKWYRDSAICYVYLADCIALTELARSRWFARGWTLQELISPYKMLFFGKDWNSLGTKDGLCIDLERITTIPREILRRTQYLRETSVAKRMSWAADRETTRPEDIAYCLLGIFDVNIPLLYGEGGVKAFRRLQEAIMRSSTDHSILVWQPRDRYDGGVLASSPFSYRYSGRVVQDLSHIPDSYELNNAGIRINLPLADWQNKHFVLLDCRYEDDFCGIIGLQVDIIRTASNGLTTVRRKQASQRDTFNFDVFNSEDGGQQVSAPSTPLLIVRYDQTPNRNVYGSEDGWIYKMLLQRDHRCTETLRVVSTSPPSCWDEKNQMFSPLGSIAGGRPNYNAHILLRQYALRSPKVTRRTNIIRQKRLHKSRNLHALLLAEYDDSSRRLSIKARALPHEPDHDEIARLRDSDKQPWTEFKDEELNVTRPVSISSAGLELHVTITICRRVVMATPTYVVKLASSDTDAVTS